MDDKNRDSQETQLTDGPEQISVSSSPSASDQGQVDSGKNKETMVSLKESARALNEALKDSENEILQRIQKPVEEFLRDRMVAIEDQLRGMVFRLTEEIVDEEIYIIIEKEVEKILLMILERPSSNDNTLRSYLMFLINDRLGILPGVEGSVYQHVSDNINLCAQVAHHRKTTRFSATVNQQTLDAVRELGGVLSQHVQAAMKLYLGHQEETDISSEAQAPKRK